MPNFTHFSLLLLALSLASEALAEGSSWHVNLTPSVGSGQSSAGILGSSLRSSLGAEVRFSADGFFLGPTASIAKETFSVSEKQGGLKQIGTYDVLNWDAGLVAGVAINPNWHLLSRLTYGQGDVRATIDRSQANRYASYRFTNLTMQEYQLTASSEWKLTSALAVAIGANYRMATVDQSRAEYSVASVIAEPTGGLSLSASPQEPVRNFFDDTLDLTTLSLEAGITFTLW